MKKNLLKVIAIVSLFTLATSCNEEEINPLNGQKTTENTDQPNKPNGNTQSDPTTSAIGF